MLRRATACELLEVAAESAQVDDAMSSAYHARAWATHT